MALSCLVIMTIFDVGTQFIDYDGNAIRNGTITICDATHSDDETPKRCSAYMLDVDGKSPEITRESIYPYRLEIRTKEGELLSTENHLEFDADCELRKE